MHIGPELNGLLPVDCIPRSSRMRARTGNAVMLIETPRNCVNGIGPMPVGENRSRRIGAARTAMKNGRTMPIRLESVVVVFADEDVRNRARFQLERGNERARRCSAHPVGQANSREIHARGDIGCDAAKHRWAKQSLGNFTGHMSRPVYFRWKISKVRNFAVPSSRSLGQTAGKNRRKNGITPRQSSYLYRHVPSSVSEIVETARPPGVFVCGSKASLLNHLL